MFYLGLTVTPGIYLAFKVCQDFMTTLYYRYLELLSKLVIGEICPWSQCDVMVEKLSKLHHEKSGLKETHKLVSLMTGNLN
jgi:hypothetical protein